MFYYSDVLCYFYSYYSMYWNFGKYCLVEERVGIWVGILLARFCRFGSKFWRCFIYFCNLWQIVCSYGLFIICPIFFFNNSRTHIHNTPTSSTPSTNTPSTTSIKAANLITPISSTVLEITSKLALSNNYLILCLSFVDKAWFNIVAIDFNLLDPYKDKDSDFENCCELGWDDYGNIVVGLRGTCVDFRVGWRGWWIVDSDCIVVWVFLLLYIF